MHCSHKISGVVPLPLPVAGPKTRLHWCRVAEFLVESDGPVARPVLRQLVGGTRDKFHAIVNPLIQSQLVRVEDGKFSLTIRGWGLLISPNLAERRNETEHRPSA